ncbi:MAG: SGNH/GDSL hydrolase family protein [Chloroflexota bacterium]
MHRRWHKCLIVLGLFLLACGGETAVVPTPISLQPAPTPTIPQIFETPTPIPTPKTVSFCDNQIAEPLTILSLGDSYTIGENIAEKDRYPNQLRDALQLRGIAVTDPIIIARTGWTTADLLTAVDEASISEKFDIVTLLIGVNNQYRGLDLEQYEIEFKELLTYAISQSKLGAERVFVLSIPDWGATPFAHRRNREQIGLEIDSYNTIKQRLTLEAGSRYINITPLSRQALQQASFTSSDFLHPSGYQYGFWVEEFLTVLCQIQT